LGGVQVPALFGAGIEWPISHALRGSFKAPKLQMSVAPARLRLITKEKEALMISTALAIQEATRDAIFDSSTVSLINQLIESKDMLDEDSLIKALFQYSAHLSALTASLVTSICLTEDQMENMVNTIKEFDSFGKEME
jgi:hypothetical protein